jgi:hypothetical protein
LHYFIQTSWKAKKTVACAFLDIKSAFDAAWHPMILRGLICKDCPRYLIKLIEVFLLDRTATISSDDEVLCTTLEVGCPQGSILSPFLWNILLESLFLLSFSFDFIIIAYADDVLLCATSVLAHLAVSNLQLMCNSVVDWGLNSKLSFNALKTVFMVFSRKIFLSICFLPCHKQRKYPSL